MDIKELALKIAEEMGGNLYTLMDRCEDFATRLIAAYTEGEEPDESQNWKGMSGAVAWHLIDRHGEDWADIGNKMDSWLKANTAPPEPAPQQQKPQTTTGDSADPAQPAAACAAPSSEEVALKKQNAELLIFVKKISEQIPEKPDYWNSCSQCEHNASEAEDLLIAAGEVKP